MKFRVELSLDSNNIDCDFVSISDNKNDINFDIPFHLFRRRIPDSWQNIDSALTRYVDIRRFSSELLDAKFPLVDFTSCLHRQATSNVHTQRATSNTICANISTSNCPNISTSNCPNISTEICPNISTSNCPKISTEIYPNITTSNCPNIFTTSNNTTATNKDIINSFTKQKLSLIFSTYVKTSRKYKPSH